MEEVEQPQIPSLPSYADSKSFLHPKQQGPLNKMLGKMLKPKMHRMIKNSLKRTKNKHKVTFY